MTMNSTRLALITAIVAATGPTGAATAGRQAGADHVGQQADTDHVGQQADTDHVGQQAGVDRAGQQAGGGMRGAMMRADTDHDGRISRAEYLVAVDARFARLDRRGDGKLTADELHPDRGATQGAAQARSAPGGAAGSMPSTGGTKQMARIDTDHDGTISRDEYRARAEQRFDRIDANHDGYLDRSEIEAARNAAGVGHPAGRPTPGRPAR